MTDTEVILAALAAGAGAGTSDAAKAAVTDVYTGLRDALRRLLAGRPTAQQALESDDSDPEIWRARLGSHLSEVGAARDEQIMSAARQLLNLIDQSGIWTVKNSIDAREAKGVQIGDYNIQHNTF